MFMLGIGLLKATGLLNAAFWQQTADSGVIANFQTIFNLVTAVVLLPFTGELVKLSMLLVKDVRAKPL